MWCFFEASILCENRESNQRASNQRCEKINNDEHK